MGLIYTTEEREYAAYDGRCEKRQKTLYIATMNFVKYFMELGDTQTTAESKVSQVSTESASYLYAYVLGNKDPLIASINNSTLSFMDDEAKSKLIGDLSI